MLRSDDEAGGNAAPSLGANEAYVGMLEVGKCGGVSCGELWRVWRRAAAC